MNDAAIIISARINDDDDEPCSCNNNNNKATELCHIKTIASLLQELIILAIKLLKIIKIIRYIAILIQQEQCWFSNRAIYT